MKKTLAERLRAIQNKGNVLRVASVIPDGIDIEARTVEIAFSSESEVPQWFGVEILDHSPGAVSLDRLKDGAALLMDHDWTDQVGVIEAVSIDPDRRGRATVRFGRGSRASEIFQDVVDKIRKHVSVGYQILDAKLIEERGDTDVWLITSWQPYEISFVSVPADVSVGVGRNLEMPPEEPDAALVQNQNHQVIEPLNETPKMEKILRDASTGHLVRAKVDDAGKILEVLEILERAGDNITSANRAGGEAERSRVSSIMALGARFQQRELADKYISDGKTATEFQDAVLAVVERKIAAPLNDQSRARDIGLSDKEVRKFSLVKVVRAMADPSDRSAQKDAAFEFEVSEAARSASGRSGGESKFMIPTDVLRHSVMGTYGERVISAGTNGQTGAGSTGNADIATTLMAGSFIDILRHRTTIMKLGQTMAGLVGNVDIPKQTSKTQGYWLGEDDAATEGNIDFGQIPLTPKTVAAFSDITRKLLMQSSNDVEALVRFDLAKALALAIDTAGYYGTGTNHQPMGIANYTGVNAVPFAAAFPTYPEIIQLETAIAADDADVPNMRYVANAKFRGAMKSTLKFQAAGSATIWEPGGTMNGYGAETTNQIHDGDVFFGNYSDLLIGMWGGLELTVDPYSNSNKGRIRIVVFQDVDFALRRVESFALGRIKKAPLVGH